MLTDPSGAYLEVVEEDCVGCNLCSIVCPVDGAIEMIELTPEQEPVTWNERQSAISLLQSIHNPSAKEAIS